MVTADFLNPSFQVVEKAKQHGIAIGAALMNAAGKVVEVISDFRESVTQLSERAKSVLLKLTLTGSAIVLISCGALTSTSAAVSTPKPHFVDSMPPYSQPSVMINYYGFPVLVTDNALNHGNDIVSQFQTGTDSSHLNNFHADCDGTTVDFVPAPPDSIARAAMTADEFCSSDGEQILRDRLGLD